jgi:hypothetical protein
MEMFLEATGGSYQLVPPFANAWVPDYSSELYTELVPSLGPVCDRGKSKKKHTHLKVTVYGTGLEDS